MSEFGTLKSRLRVQALEYNSVISFCAVPGFDFMVHLNLSSKTRVHTITFYANSSDVISEILRHYNAE